MEKTMRFLSIAALALVGTMMTGCSSEDNFTAQPQQQVADKGNVVTMTATVGFDEQAGTRALKIDYTNKKLTKTFADGDKIAVIYENTSGTMVKAETAALTATDITSGGKSAKITVTMTDPKASGTLKYIYPAAMAGATDVDYTKLNSQDGTLASLAANLDLAVFEGTLTAEKALPASASLTNKLAILALKIKNSDGTNDLTSTITGMTLSGDTNSYSITGKDTDGRIYAAIQATSEANILCFATTASGNYAKSLTGKTYAANNIYDLGLKMDAATTVSLASVTEDTEVGNCSILTGTLDSNKKISIADGAIVLLKDVTINGTNNDSYTWAGITCSGDATIILEGTNTVTGFHEDYPGIHVPKNKTLIIQGTGSLTATSNGSGAGIGGGDMITCGNIKILGGSITASANSYGAGIGSGCTGECGDITISGGTVTAKGGEDAAGIGSAEKDMVGNQSKCGNITISGGTVTATGRGKGAGIGTGYQGICGTITITSDVNKVMATMDDDGCDVIGNGTGGTCGTVTIGGTVYYDGEKKEYQNNGLDYLRQNSLTYPSVP